MKKLLFLIFVLVAQVVSQVSLADSEKPQGWQFYNFFGTYFVESSECLKVGTPIWLGFKYSKDFPALQIGTFSDPRTNYFVYLRNTNTHGEECYECDPDWWEIETVGGDGTLKATFEKKGIEPYTHKPYLTSIAIEKSKRERFKFLWGSCAATLVRH